MRFCGELLKQIEAIRCPAGIETIEWHAVSADSRNVTPGTVFVAIRGERLDGNAFALDAVTRGACMVVSERTVDLAVPVVVVKDARLALAVLAGAASGEPTRSLKLVGITGTDGKTSTAMMVESGLKACGLSCGLLSTVVYRWAGEERPSFLTTPDPVALQGMFADMVSRGVRAAVMEVSSHALDQRRVDGCAFDVACFTNLTRDHLDYHKTVEAYAAAKLRLFSEVLPASSKAKGAVVNLSDPFSEKIRLACPIPVLTYSLDGDADIYPIEASYGIWGTRALIATPWGKVTWDSRLIGPHNLSNAMAAIGVVGVLGLSVDMAASGMGAMDRIRGRLEAVRGRRPVTVFVDYSHTPRSVENVLTVLRSLVKEAAITIVFGAGGDRDRGKRPLMGRAAATLADRVIVTSDNPRSEDPLAIISEIVHGIEAARAEGVSVAPYTIEPDRRRAIQIAIEGAKAGDVVVLAGKGHEDYQIIGTEKRHFDDVEVAKEILDS